MTKEYYKKYRLKNKNKIIEYSKEYYLKNKNKKKEYLLKNKQAIKERHKKYRLKNKDTIKNYNKKYRLENKDKIKKYNLENKSNRNKKVLLYEKNRRKIDINFKLLCNLRSRLNKALKGLNKSSATIELIGCSIDELKLHLQAKFANNMNWNNYGKWHIDHIKPCAAFDLTKEAEQKKCFHYSNLQPLWAEDNIKKSDSLVADK